MIVLFLLALLVIIGVATARLAHLFPAVMLFGMYSLVSAALFVALDAVDVAFTEAAVGAGISTILMLATLAATSARQRTRSKIATLPLAAALAVGALLLWATADLPPIGDPNAPANLHVVPRYLQDSLAEVGVPNVVTSVLASYRGYDTLGEVTVIFTAGIGVLCLIGGQRRRGAGKD